MGKILYLIFGMVVMCQVTWAQKTGCRMNVKMTDGSFFSVATKDIEEVYFSLTQEKQFENAYYTVSGRAEKGPFKSGSTVTMQPLDQTLQVLGSTQTTQTFDDCGSYAFRNTLFKYPYVMLTVTGLFFNEYDDYKTRDDQLTLQGYANLMNSNKVNVNVVTHLISERLINLVIGGTDFDVALRQAQGELLSLFGLQRLNDKDFTQVSITDGDDYAAALLAISMPLLYYRNGSELTSWLTRLRYDFADDGKLTEQNWAQYQKDRNNMSLSYYVERLVKKYQDYGVTVSVKDLKYFYDWDGDGVAGNEIYDKSQPATCDMTTISAPKEGGTYTAHVSCHVPLYTTPLNSGSYNPMYNPLGQYLRDYMSRSSEYNNGVWTIKIEPAQYKFIGDATIQLYDAVGTVVVSINISQAGNPEGTFLTEQGKAMVEDIYGLVAQSHAKYRIADAKYTGVITDDYFKAPLSPNNYTLENLFSYPYQVFNRTNQLLRMANESNTKVLNPMCYVADALMYYELITLFGDVPYITDSQDSYYIPRTSSEEIFNTLVGNLKSVMDKLDEVKAGYVGDADRMALPPKDLVRILLADIYMYQGKYAEAKILLKDIVDGNRYSLVAGVNNLEKDCPEVIWSLPSANQNNVTRASVITIDENLCIVKTYADVLLSLAECESKLGDEEQAQKYLSQVKTAKNIETSSLDVIQAISEVRSKIQVDYGGYFAFLKRTGLAQSVLGLEAYQLLFPIPQTELSRNPAMQQNPGYTR